MKQQPQEEQETFSLHSPETPTTAGQEELDSYSLSFTKVGLMNIDQCQI